MWFIDAHAHLTHEQFSNDAKEALTRGKETTPPHNYERLGSSQQPQKGGAL